MFNKFLLKNREKILALTEKKTLELAADHQSSQLLKQGLPIFYTQLIGVIQAGGVPSSPPEKDIDAIAEAADRGDEQGMAEAAGQTREADLAVTAGHHGAELLRLGYSLSHVVHAYGAMCQAITEVAEKDNFSIKANEFHALNRCLDVAIAGAVTAFQFSQDTRMQGIENKSNKSLAHEMRTALTGASMALQLIKRGTVGVSGHTGDVLEKSLKRMENLLEQFVARFHNKPLE